MARATSILVIAALFLASVFGKQEDCSKLVCEDTQYGFLGSTPKPDGKGACMCAPYFSKKSPCFNKHCPRKHLAVEKNGDCKCINPCAGLKCTPPNVLEPDYTRATSEHCKCVVGPTKSDYPLPTNALAADAGADDHFPVHMARQHLKGECDNHACDTQKGYLKYWAEKDDKGKCTCNPVYGPGSPCHTKTCQDGFLILEKGNKCECADPCSDKVCDPPYSPMIDYMRETSSLCKCVVLKKSKKSEL